MRPHHPTAYVSLLLLALLAGCDSSDMRASPPLSFTEMRTESPKITNGASGQAAARDESGVIELDWDALIPADWRLDKLMEDYNADELTDDDPRTKELMEKLKTFWKEAPVVNDYDGKTVKLPGFVVPLEMDAKTIQEFLLVPYYGACIHTPPPPANQTVHVMTEAGNAYHGQLFDTVWVTGTIRIERLSSELGDAGYRIEAMKVEPYL